MRSERLFEEDARNEGRTRRSRPRNSGHQVRVEKADLRHLVEKLLFGERCSECSRMSSIPQSAYAVLQVRKNFQRSYATEYQDEEGKRDNKNCGFNAKNLQEGRELTPLKYNSKLMNSIWGLYNRYSVHNFKKIDANAGHFLAGAWGSALAPGNAAVVRAEGIGGR